MHRAASSLIFCLLALSAGRLAAVPLEPGLKSHAFSSIPFTAQGIRVDGQLDDWKGVAGYEYNPLAGMPKSAKDPVVAALVADPVSVNFKACYDAQGIYVAVEWRDRKPGAHHGSAADAADWPEGGEGFEIHLRTDQVIHLACWPSAGGAVVMGRRDDDPQWQNLSRTLLAAGAVGAGGKSYVMELAVPWSMVTASGKIPADGKVQLGCDFAWNAVPSSLIPTLRDAVMDAQGSVAGVSYNFLTNRANLVAADPLVMNTIVNWGDVGMGDRMTGDAAKKQADGSTSSTSLSLPAAAVPPKLDGTLAGWDPAWLQTANYLGALFGNRFQCQIAGQFDQDNLYLAAVFPGDAPANVASAVSGKPFSGGDVLRLQMSDGEKKFAIDGWYDSRAGQPALVIEGGASPNASLLAQGAKEVFKADGKGGYLQEMAVPWKALLGAAPKLTDEVKGTFRFGLADVSNRFSLFADITLEQHPALSVAYKMPADGELTLGLFDKDGQLLKWLAQGDYRYAGDNREAWDGLDQFGNPVAAGNYVLKGVYHPPLTADYKMSVCNPGTPPWPTPDGKGDWLGDEHDPQAAVSDGKWVYLAAPGSELGYAIIAVDENGQRQWGVRANETGDRSVSLALSGDYIYALYSGGKLTDDTKVRSYDGTNGIGKAWLACYDKKTGKPARFTFKQPNLVLTTWPYRNDFTWLYQLRNNKSFTPQVYGGQPRYYCTDVGETTNALGMAALGDVLYVSLNYDNKIIAVDATTGVPNGLEIPVDSPVGLCPLDDHTLLAISGKQVVKVDVTSKQVTPLITSNLVAPDNLTTDKDGNIYVSDWATSFQVKVFNSSGTFLRAIGKEGGRPWVGKWDASGMLVPRGVAVTDAGKVWVAEDDGSPKRVSVWDSKTGALLKDYIGPAPYGGGTLFWMDPKDPTLAHCEGTSFKMDFATKTYTPVAIDFRRQNGDDAFTPIGHSLNVRQGRVLYHDGHEYLIDRDKITKVLERKGDVYRPVTALGSVFTGYGNDGTEVIDWDSLLYHPYKNFFPDCFKGHMGYAYSWSDTSGDNLVQPDEMQWVQIYHGPYKDGMIGPMGAGWGNDIGPDWSYYTISQFSDHVAIVRVPLKGWTATGAPTYDLSQAKAIAFLPPKNAIGNIHATDDGKVIISYSFEGMGLWNNATDAIDCFDAASGKKLWGIVQPKRTEGKAVHANGVQFDFNVPQLGDVFGTWLYHGSCRPFLITTDGLYVGTLLDNTWIGPRSLRGESAVYYYQGPDGTPYIINGANQAEHVFQINGLDKCARFEGGYQLSDDDVKLAADMRNVPQPEVPPQPVLAVTWLDKPPAIEGDLSDWNMDEGVSLDGGNGKTARIALGRDTDNLYLAYKVHEPTPPMRNGGADWHSLFVSGDCVDLMLQTDPAANPSVRAPGPGDERLLISMFQDKPVAVLYRPVVVGTTAPVSLASAQIDHVVQLDSAKVAIKRDADRGTYTVEAAVPLRDLHFDPKLTDDIRGDAGVIFADETGTSRSLRLYFYNHNTAMIDDLATEATLQPNEWGKLALPLGLNLVKNGGFEDTTFVDSKDDLDKGWFIDEARNGNDAVISTDAPYSGHHSLLLEASEPVTFSPETYKYPVEADFLRMANGGRGNGEVQVRQRVPVIAGHQYSMRFRMRSQDYSGARKEPGHPRGYVIFSARIEWQADAGTPGHGARTGVGDPYNTHAIERPLPDWLTVYDTQVFAPPAPYTAPEGATSADVVFYMRNVMDALPKFYFDDVEFVDVTPNPVTADAAK